MICPICGSTEYSEVRKGNGICGPGYHSYLLYYKCSGCSVLFLDPKKFFANKTPNKAFNLTKAEGRE